MRKVTTPAAGRSMAVAICAATGKTWAITLKRVASAGATAGISARSASTSCLWAVKMSDRPAWTWVELSH